MSTQKVTKEYRMAQWTKIIQARQSSGQNVKEFCITQGLSRNAYFYWQRKLREIACTELAKTEDTHPVPAGWVRFASEPVTAASLAIEVNGCHITVTAETDPTLLSQTCRMLRAL